MEYNELKRIVLELIESSAYIDSFRVRAILRGRIRVRFSRHAVEMALYRYYRQGLLLRERRGRRYYYLITDKGKRRLEWLRSAMRK